MEEKIIDCTKIKTREDLHRIFRETLSFPDWYGNNLDALYDCLTSITEQTHITLLHFDPLDQMYSGFQDVFQDAQEANPRLLITIE